ncbi:MAG: helix-turn-helix domain-containing protein [Opitutaceae bacterium]
MSDIEKFIRDRKRRNPKAWTAFEDKYRRYAIGMLLAEHREKSGMSLGEFAKRIKMQKAALSRLENHGEDVRLSTITRYVEATGRPLSLRIFPSAGSRGRTRKLSATVALESA